jgi:Cu/Ag efflux protein CusF
MMLVGSLALAACGRGDDTAQPKNTPTAAATTPMNNANMPMSNGTMPTAQASGMSQMTSAEGTVTAVDDQAGTISIKHGAIAAVNWPAMTMAFKADNTMRQQVAVGDKVAFSFKLSNGSGELTAINKK